MTLGRMGISSWVPNDENKESKYVIRNALLLQQ